VLEVGCGPGHLWAANADRVPSGWSALLTDFSPGMVTISRARLGDRFGYAVADAVHAALANHMLYHVPDRPRAVRELARVLRPDGVLYAAANGRDHLREIDDLVSRWLPSGTIGGHVAQFGLENGAEQLGAGFASVEVSRWENALEVTEAEPVVAYVRSMSAGSRVDLEGLRRETARVIDREGVLRVRTETGLFIARGPMRTG